MPISRYEPGLYEYTISFIGGLAKQYDPALAARMKAKAALYRAAIGVGRGGDKPRKDYGNWRDAAAFLSFYDADTFTIRDSCPENADGEMRQAILTAYLDSLSFADTPEEWFAKVKVLTEQLGYAVQPKKYKKNPELYKGSIVDVTNLIRVALTGRQNAPDICEISHVLGEAETRRRLEAYMHA